MNRKQLRELKENLVLWKEGTISKLALVRRIGAMFATTEADAYDSARERFERPRLGLGGCKSLVSGGGCIGRLVAA